MGTSHRIGDMKGNNTRSSSTEGGMMEEDDTVRGGFKGSKLRKADEKGGHAA